MSGAGSAALSAKASDQTNQTPKAAAAAAASRKTNEADADADVDVDALLSLMTTHATRLASNLPKGGGEQGVRQGREGRGNIFENR